MVPSDTYHNFIQTHIAFTLYFPLPFWLLTASSRLKFYLNGSILTWGENTAQCYLLNSIHYCRGRVLTWGQAPCIQSMENFKGKTAATAEMWKSCWATKSESGRGSQWNLSPWIKAEPEALGLNAGRKTSVPPVSRQANHNRPSSQTSSAQVMLSKFSVLIKKTPQNKVLK